MLLPLFCCFVFVFVNFFGMTFFFPGFQIGRFDVPAVTNPDCKQKLEGLPATGVSAARCGRVLDPHAVLCCHLHGQRQAWTGQGKAKVRSPSQVDSAASEGKGGKDQRKPDGKTCGLFRPYCHWARSKPRPRPGWSASLDRPDPDLPRNCQQLQP